MKLVNGWMPLVDAARALKVTYHQAYARLIDGRLDGRRIEGRWYVRRRAVQVERHARSRAARQEDVSGR